MTAPLLFLNTVTSHSTIVTVPKLRGAFCALRYCIVRCINTYTPIGGNVMNTVRWNVAVSADTDQSLRMFLASQGGGRKGDLSRFIEEAVRSHILELSAEQAKASNEGISEDELSSMVDEALDWARNR